MPSAGAATFSNPAAIAIPTQGNAAPYPSPIAVSGLTGTITDVNVTLNNYSHTDPEDVAVVLVPPSGTNILLMDGPGGTSEVSGVNITFDDSAPGFLPRTTAFPSGSYKPTAYFTGTSFPAPGPLTNYCNPGSVAGGTCTLASALNGNNPNGTWNLYVIDVDSPDSGSIAGGWSLDITSAVAPPKRTLTVSKGGSGSGTVTSSPAGINCGADCTEDYNEGASVTLTASPAAGSAFTGFTGGGCSGTATTCTVTIDQAKTVTATFVLKRALTVTKAGNGSGTVTSAPAGIDCGADCTEDYNEGTSVTLTANPAAGSAFTGFSGGGCSGSPTRARSVSVSTSCTVTMAQARSVTATFAASVPGPTYPLPPGGGGYPLPPGGGASVPPKATVCPNSRGVRVIGRTNSGGRVIQGTNGNDRICGTSAGDLITGNGGRDVISGGGGNDRINGGSGSDRINGGSGKDLISGGSGNDSIVGASGDDRVNGNSGRDRISGGSGSDRLNGAAGNDVISGGSDNDVISGGSGNDRLFGNAGNDRINGGSGKDRISGGSGNDVLKGGPGKDSISGGSGKNKITQ